MPILYKQKIGFKSAITRGLRRLCPSCGEGKAFSGYLQPVSVCSVCSAPLGDIRADDFPPYLTIFIVGHIVVPFALIAEQNWEWSVGLHMIVWLPLTLALLLAILPFMKGAAIGLMWWLGLKGDEQH
jgi:uncharacterized protein (DUF983 family)